MAPENPPLRRRGAVDGNRNMRALAGGTDGIGGAQDAAGGMIGPDPDEADSDKR